MKISNHLRVCLVTLACLCSGTALALPQPREGAIEPAPTNALEQSKADPPTCGANWEMISSRVIGQDLTIFNDIAALAPNDIWAVGMYNPGDSRYPQPLIAHWDGTFWTPALVPPIDPAARLEALTVIAPNDIWAVGAIQLVDSSQTLTMHWDGSTWAQVDSPNGLPTAYNALHDVDAAGPNDVWAIGDDSVSALLLHWDGSSWKSIAYPAGGQSQSLRGIVAIAPNDIWAVGSGSAYTIHWNGTAWSLVPTPIGDAQLFGVDGSSATNIWAVGTRLYQPLAMRWNGTSWSQSDIPALELGNDTLAKVAVLAPDDIWAVGFSSYSALALHWDGASWQDVSPPSSIRRNDQFRSLAALSSGNIWAVGTGFIGPGVSKTIVERYAPALELTDARVAHADGTATISASLSSTAVQTVTVAYATSDGSAIAGQDYAATSGVITIPPCQTSGSFNVPLIDNPSPKSSAILNLSISNPQGAILGGRASLGLNIADTSKVPPGQVAFMPSIARSFGSPGGDRIAYVSRQDYNTDIWLMNADGSGKRRVTDTPTPDYDPAWSPDGRRLAFVSERDGNAEIYVVNADGSQPTRLTNNPQRDTAPSWSPDGQSIAFESDRTRVGQGYQRLIYVMRADGTQQTRLTPTASGNFGDADPAWSPDSRQIAFGSQREGISAIYVINSDGRQMHRITPLSMSSSYPAWVENGRRIAFFIPEFGYPNIATIGLDGTQIKLVTANFDSHAPFSWSSDGTRIVFSDDYEISILTIAGGDPLVLPTLGPNEFDPVFAP